MSGMAPLVAVAFASIISTQLLANYTKADIRDSLAKLGAAQGQQLARLGQAANNYQTINRIQLTGGPGTILAADGVTLCSALSACPSNALAPTVPELLSLGYLSGSFNSTNYFGGGYQVTLTKIPSGCTYPNCNLEGVANLATPILSSSGLPDTWILGSAIEEIGSNGGFSKSSSPGTISGLSGGWSRTNPVGSVAGILAQQLIVSQNDGLYYRRDGANKLTAPLQMGGNKITDVQAVALGSSCTTKGDIVQDSSTGQPLYCNPTTWLYSSIGGANWVANIASLNAITCDASAKGKTYVVITPTVGTGPRGYACDGTSWKPLALDDSGNLTVSGLLTAAKFNLQKVVNVGDACNPAVDGNVAMDSTNAPLYCQSGAWARSSSAVVSQAPLSSYIGKVAYGRFLTKFSGLPARITVAKYPYGGSPPNNTALMVETSADGGITWAAPSWFCNSAGAGNFFEGYVVYPRYFCSDGSAANWTLTPTGIFLEDTVTSRTGIFPWQ